MPQFNWPVVGPLLLILALIAAAGIYLDVRTHQPQPPQHTPAATAHVQTVRLSGHVSGTPHLRTSPSSNAAVLEDLQNDQTVAVTACSDACIWYRIAPPDGSPGGWVPAAYIGIQGDDHTLPVVR